MRKSIAEKLDEYFSRLAVFYFSSLLGRKYFVTFRESKAYLESCGLEDVESFFPPPKELDREVSEMLQGGSGWYTLPTSLPIGIKEDDRVPVRFYPAPKETPSKGGVILLHGLMMSSDLLFKPLIHALQKDGFDVLLPAAPFHFDRTPSGIQSGEFILGAHFLRAVDTLRQGVTDARALLHAYRSLTMQPAGIVGVSMGGLIGGWLDVLEEVDFSVLVVPALQFEPTLLHLPLGKTWQRRIMDTDLHEHMEEVTGWMKWLEPASHPLKSNPESVLLLVAKYDRIVSLTELSPEGEIREWKGVTVEYLPLGHVGVALSLGAVSIVADWASGRAAEKGTGGL